MEFVFTLESQTPILPEGSKPISRSRIICFKVLVAIGGDAIYPGVNKPVKSSK